MLKLKRDNHYQYGNFIELSWAPQSDPSSSNYSCWSPDPTKQGSMTVPINVVDDLVEAMQSLAKATKFKVIELVDE